MARYIPSPSGSPMVIVWDRPERNCQPKEWKQTHITRDTALNIALDTLESSKQIDFNLAERHQQLNFVRVIKSPNHETRLLSYYIPKPQKFLSKLHELATSRGWISRAPITQPLDSADTYDPSLNNKQISFMIISPSPFKLPR